MPMHVRWELYPVAHEKGRASYGGSYFEEVDWWTKPREVDKLGEVDRCFMGDARLRATGRRARAAQGNRARWPAARLGRYAAGD